MRLLKLKRLWRAAVPALAAGAVLALSPAARALPLDPGLEGTCTISGCTAVYWDPEVDANANGHYYAFVAGAATSWADANAVARGSALGGSHGYLATVADAYENSFITGSVLPAGYTHKNQAWLGAVQNPGAATPSSDWHWIAPGIVPEVWDYTDWTPGEPNDENAAHTGNEDHLAMWVHYYVAQSVGFAIDLRGEWNDEGPTSETNAPIVGYVVEWGGGVPVPEPGAALLGLLGIGLVARRFRC